MCYPFGVFEDEYHSGKSQKSEHGPDNSSDIHTRLFLTLVGPYRNVSTHPGRAIKEWSDSEIGTSYWYLHAGMQIREEDSRRLIVSCLTVVLDTHRLIVDIRMLIFDLSSPQLT